MVGIICLLSTSSPAVVPLQNSSTSPSLLLHFPSNMSIPLPIEKSRNVCVCVCVCVRVYMCVCVHTCMCVCTHTAHKKHDAYTISIDYST